MARSAPKLVVPKKAGELRPLLVQRRLAGDLTGIDQVLGVVLAEKPSPRTDAVLFEAFLAIADERLDAALVRRAWPMLLARAFGPQCSWRAGAMYALSRALDADERHRGSALSLARRAMASRLFPFRDSPASVVALACSVAAAERDEATRSLALAAWPRAIDRERKDRYRNDDLLLWSLETMVATGAVGEVIEALGRLDASFRKLAARRKPLRSLKLPKPPSGPALRAACIEALRARRAAHSHRKVSAAAITTCLLGDRALPPSLSAVLLALGEIPDFTGTLRSRVTRSTAKLLAEMGVLRAQLPALAAALPGESLLLGDASLLYAGRGHRADGELPVLTFVEKEESLVLEAPSYELWLAVRTDVVRTSYVGALAVDPDHRREMREAAKRLGSRMALRRGQYVFR